MYPSARNPLPDPRWATSGRAASLSTLAFNLALILVLFIFQTLPAPQSLPQPLTLEITLAPAAPPAPIEPLQEMPRPSPPPPPDPVQPRAEEPKALKAPAATPKKTIKPKPKAKALPPPAQPPAATTPAASVPPLPEAANTAEIATESAPPPQVPPQDDVEDSSHIVSNLAALIEQHKHYPKAARRAGYEGVVVIVVSIDQNGVITEWRLQEASEYAVLDRAAEKTFAKLLGKKIQGPQRSKGLQVVVPIRYELRSG